MAISVENTYPGRSKVGDANYPEGSIKNEVVPDVSDDGTPLDELWGNDYEGVKQAILRSGSIVPTVPGNVPDTAIASQQLQGLIEMMQGRATNYTDSGAADAYVLDVQANQQAPASLFDGQIFEFIAGNTNTGASTVNPVGLGVKNIVNTTVVGAIAAGKRVRIRYRSGSGDFEIIGGKVVQTVNVETGAVATGSTTMPLDDTIPQITEGDEYMTLAITPKNVNNLLVIEVRALLASTVGNSHMTGALFETSTHATNALAAMIGNRNASGNARATVVFSHFMTAPGVVPVTFRFRAGNPNAGTTTFNGAAGVRELGGVMASSITITEIEP